MIIFGLRIFALLKDGSLGYASLSVSDFLSGGGIDGDIRRDDCLRCLIRGEGKIQKDRLKD